MSKVTTIKWRPYPEQKPDSSWFVYVALDEKSGRVGTAVFHGSGFGVAAPLDSVTHFALPEDITTEEK